MGVDKRTRVGFEVWLRWQDDRDDYAGRLASELRRTGRVDYAAGDVARGLAEFERFMSPEGVWEWNMLPDDDRDRARRLFNTVGLNQVIYGGEDELPREPSQLELF